MEVGEREITYLSLHCYHQNDSRWAAMKAILMFHNCEGQSHKTVSTDHSLCGSERRAEADSNWGPSAYHPSTLPLGQTGSHPCSLSSFCFTSTEARWLIRDGDGGGGGGKGTKKWKLVDRRQNNGSVKAVSPRHCPAISALRSCCFNCRSWAVTRTMSVAPLLRNNSKRKKYNFRIPAPPHSLLMISSGLNEGPASPPSSRSLDLLISSRTLPYSLDR